MNKVKVSIIVPIYNSQRYIKECVDSLINQSLPDIEIILVDDGSTDKSGEIIDVLEKEDERIVVFHQENGGIGSARNTGLRNANGEYILFLDSDDYIRLDSCEVLYGTAINKKCDIVCGDMLTESEEIFSNHKFRWIPSEGQNVTCSQYLYETIKYNCYDVVTTIRLIKRKYIIDNKLYFCEGRYFEDQEYTLKLLSAEGGTGRICKIRFPFYYYRTNPSSVTTVVSTRKVRDLLVSLKEMYDYTMKYGKCKREYLNAMKAVVGLCMYHLGFFYIKLSNSEKLDLQIELSSNKNMFKKIAHWNAISTRIRISNSCFAICPLQYAKSIELLRRIFSFLNTKSMG